MTKAAELREQHDEQLELLLGETQQNLFRLRSKRDERLRGRRARSSRRSARSPGSRRVLRSRKSSTKRRAATAKAETETRLKPQPTESVYPRDANRQPPAPRPDQPRRKTEIGVVTSDKMNRRRESRSSRSTATQVRQTVASGGRSVRR